jgi:hypothetical protein
MIRLIRHSTLIARSSWGLYKHNQCTISKRFFHHSHFRQFSMTSHDDDDEHTVSLSSIIKDDSDWDSVSIGDPRPDDPNTSLQNWDLAVKRCSDTILEVIDHEFTNLLHIYAKPGFVENLKRVYYIS